MILRRSLLILFTAALPLIGLAQDGIVVIGLPHSENQNHNNTRSSGRTKALELPFWEDFSSTTTTFANPDVWLFGKSVLISDGLAIRPPSLKVATFDGIDSVGKPYNVNDVLAKGYADKLVSQSIDLTAIPEADRDSVFFSYQYQLKGRGESPDAGDRLLVSFFDKDSEWIPVDTISNEDGTLEADVFYRSKVHVNDPRYYHPDFKFRIQNFARLSGPYDMWHVDYIYLNSHGTINDIAFPDRSISEPLTSIFGKYWIMPASHFVMNSTLTKPTLIATTLQTSQDQPFDYSSSAAISYWLNKDTVGLGTVSLDNHLSIDAALAFGEYTPVPATNLPDVLTAAATADTVFIDYKFWLSTKDNESIFPDSPTDNELGDYDPRIYSPIDFRSNDTTRVVYSLMNKYAYDDGVGEYGAGLNQPGAQIAYRFELVGKKQENITFLEMYFPRFGDESSQVIELRIWTGLHEDSVVYKEIATLQRSQQNEFWLKKLANPVPVGKVFYIGWKQNSAATIAAGLDKNTDTGDKMWYNTNGQWIQNSTVHGSLMLRPVFGIGPAVDPNGLEDETTLTVYPNPSTGTFNFGGVAERITVYDMTGRSISFVTESTADETIVTLPNASYGIYIIRAYVKGAVRTAKVMVR